MHRALFPRDGGNWGFGICNLQFAIVLLLCALCVLCGESSFAQTPATTTVQDTVYRSDGSLASGSVVISWPSFVTADNKAVFGGTKTVTLTNGAFSVALVPNVGGNPVTSYKVKYYQSGGIWADETWIVPSSPTPLTLAQVRVTAAPGGSTTISANQVVGTAVVDNPTTTQPITAPVATGVPLQIKGRSGNNSHIFDIFDNAGTPANQGYFDASGSLFLNKAPTFSTLTQGSVLFAGTGGLLSQNNPNLFWDNTAKELFAGTRSGFLPVLGNTDGATLGVGTLNAPSNPFASVYGLTQDNSTGNDIWGIGGAVAKTTGVADGLAGGLFGTFYAEHSSGTQGILTGLYTYGQADVAGGTVTHFAGVYADTNVRNAGTITNNYGLFVNNQAGVGTNNWAIKTGSGSVEFGDMLSFYASRAPTSGDANVASIDAEETFTSSGTFPGLNGVYIAPTFSGTATLTDGFYGINASPTAAAGTINKFVGVSAYVPNNGSAVTDQIGLWSQPVRTTGTTANMYGVKVENVTGANNNWAIKTGLGLVEFGDQVKSTVTTGTAPLIIASTTAVPNLNADLVDGQHASAFAASNAATTVNGQNCALGLSCTVADSTKVPATTTVNGHALSANVTVSASDVGLGSVVNADTTNASNISSGTLNSARLPSNSKVGSFGATFDGGGSPLSAGTAYVTVPFACTIAAINILVDTGTATFTTWRKITGTAIPTVSDSISTSGISISSGTALHSTTVTDFTSTTISANDIIGIHLNAVSSATWAQYLVECDRT